MHLPILLVSMRFAQYAHIGERREGCGSIPFVFVCVFVCISVVFYEQRPQIMHWTTLYGKNLMEYVRAEYSIAVGVRDISSAFLLHISVILCA